MAKARTRTVTTTPTIRIQTPSPIVRAASARRRGGRVRRVAGAVGGAVASEKHTVAALAGAAALGLARRSGVAIPTIGGLSPEATAGLAAWAYGRFSRNQTAQHVATGLLAVAVHQWASGGAGKVEGDDDVMGTAVAYEDDMEP